MSQLIFLILNSVNSMIFIMMKHPMSMGVTLLIQTVIICVITSNMSKTSWFSYILFLVFLGGMLVLFIYMTSVASNELFLKNKISSFITIITGTVLLMMMFALIDPMLLNNNSQETMDLFIKNSEAMMTMSLFNYPNNIMTIAVVLYLFLTLVVVVKITESHQGPLRSNN
uniref:NADH-ubiquinone oxidoreductase chain 6 n=1 Tax=Ceriagrion fallax TaxID=638462 RepID=A0A873WRY6_9ODON|nr:NADH dehydrogenase subunit 6 [Ceriagrion fallax]QPB15095.1 NADH dehydrogenase subunit 6 [Ceriagrion fallax]